MTPDPETHIQFRRRSQRGRAGGNTPRDSQIDFFTKMRQMPLFSAYNPAWEALYSEGASAPPHQESAPKTKSRQILGYAYLQPWPAR